MSVLTEHEIRRRLSREDLKELKEYEVIKGQIITPSAKSFLAENNITLKYIDKSKEGYTNNVGIKEVIKEIIKEKEYKYVTVFGAKLDEKPEHMTQLKGNLLVFKDDKTIVFRGKVDSLESKILETQVLCHKNGMKKLVDDLQEILNFVRNIIRCEVLDEKLEDFTLQGMIPEDMREMSHYPKKFFNMGHEIIDYKMGEEVVALNTLRSLTRETELAAYNAFRGEYGDDTREDLIKALNRLSSVFWIMIFKVRTGKYK